MNERTLRDKLNALAPLVLRLGLAAILAQNGLSRAAPLVRSATGQTEPLMPAGPEAPRTEASPADFTLSGEWSSLLGVGEVGAAGMLAAGFFTRLLTLPILGVLAYALVRAQGWLAGSGAMSGFDNSAAMLLLAAACLSLLVSGSGCASWDSLVWSRRQKRTAAGMVA